MKTVDFMFDGVEFRAEDYHYSPPVPGKYSGPPENCYPDEADEVEYDTLYLKDYDDKWKKAPEVLKDFLNDIDAFWEELMAAVREKENEQRDNY